MVKPLAKVKVGDLLKAEKMNEIIERINNLEKRLDHMEVKNPVSKTTKVKTETKTPKKKTQKAKSPNVKIPKKKASPKKSLKTGILSILDSVK